MAEQKLKGKKLPTGVWNTGELIVDSKNIDQIIKRQKSPATRKAYFQAKVKEQLANPGKYLKPAG